MKKFFFWSQKWLSQDDRPNCFPSVPIGPRLQPRDMPGHAFPIIRPLPSSTLCFIIYFPLNESMCVITGGGQGKLANAFVNTQQLKSS